MRLWEGGFAERELRSNISSWEFDQGHPSSLLSSYNQKCCHSGWVLFLSQIFKRIVGIPAGNVQCEYMAKNQTLEQRWVSLGGPGCAKSGSISLWLCLWYWLQIQSSSRWNIGFGYLVTLITNEHPVPKPLEEFRPAKGTKWRMHVYGNMPCLSVIPAFASDGHVTVHHTHSCEISHCELTCA